MRKSGTRNAERGTPNTRQLVPALLTWFAAHARDLPWRRTRDPYAIWVSEIMLQQTQVKTVIPYWERWLRELPTIQSAAKASPAKLHKLWEGLGYYARVRNLQKAAQQIVESCRRRGDESLTESAPKSESPHVVSCKFPESFDDILALPGIGRYTAGAIASIAFNQPRPILDGNVIRVLTRIFGIATDPKEKPTNQRLWGLAEELVRHAKDARAAKGLADSTLRPRRRLGAANHCAHLNQSLMELGALICTSRAPDCPACPVRNLCVAHRDRKQEQLPNLGRRAPSTVRRFVAYAVQRNGKFLVRQRPAGVVNAHLWEFPNVEVGARVSDPQHVAAKAAKLQPAGLKPLCTIRHSITRYRITLEAFRADGTDSAATNGGRWLTPQQLHKLAFTSAHKKILAMLAPSGK